MSVTLFLSRYGWKSLAVLSIVLGFGGLSIANAASLLRPFQSTIQSILEPNGTGDTLAEGDDYARTVLGDPWDMDAITDIYNEKSQNLRDVAVAGGLLSAQTTDEDSGVFLLWPGFVGDLPSIGKYGVNTPIQADRYRLLSFRMYTNQEGNGQVYWFQDAKLTFGKYGVSTWFRVQPGWHVYTLDLATIEQVEGTLAWAGEIQGLRLDPINQSGAEVKLDWVRLTPDTPQTDYTITWPTASAKAQLTNYLPLVSQNNQTEAQAAAPVYADRLMQNGKLSSAGAGQRINLYTDTDSQWSNGIFSTITTTASFLPKAYQFQTSVLPPDDYYVVAETGTDFASLTYDNAWDMADASDLSASFNFENVTFANGILHSLGTRKGWPHLTPRYDYRKPIDASIFTQLTMRMYSSQADNWAFSWWGIDEVSHSFSPDPIPTVAGWHTYTLDLAGKPDWIGQIRNIQIRPVFTTTVDIQIDWIALTPGTIPASESELGVQRSYSPGPLTVSAAPNLYITRPSMDSGEDYATATFGRPWDMRNEDSIDSSFDLREINYNGDMLNAETGSTNDPSIFLHTGGFQTATPIDADRYKYLTYRLYVEGKQDTLYGWVTRLLWWGSAGVSTHRDIVVNEGWNTYRVDLSENDVEAEASKWKGAISAVRFDPHETLAPTNLHLDSVYLRAADRANASFSVAWAGSYGPNTLVDIYYDTDKNPATKTAIATGIAAQTQSYTWNTAPIPPGEYFIYQVARDAYNSVGHYSETPVVISHSAATSARQAEPGSAPPVAARVDSVAKDVSAQGQWTIYNDLEKVTALVADGSAVWAGTRGGVARWNTPSQSAQYFTTVDGVSNNVVYAGAIDTSGDKWFGTGNGVSRFDGQAWTRYTTADGLADNRVYAVAVDAQGRKWFGTHKGVSRFDGAAWQTFTTAQGLANNLVRALAVGPGGVLWLGTDGGGLSRFDGQTWTTWTSADGLISNHIWALRVDSAGRLWVGTEAGVSRFTGAAWTSYGVADGLAAPFVRGIAQDQSGALWFATQGGGLSRYDGTAWQTYGTGQGLLDAAVYAVTVDSAGTVWAGSERGLNRFDGTAWTGIPLSATLPDNYITAIVRDGAGNTWFATPGGAVKFDGAGWTLYTTADGLLSNRVQDIAFDQQGNRWFATDAGVSKFDGTQWTSFTEKNTVGQPGGGMLHSNTTTLAVDNAGRIWMGSWLGVSVYDGSAWQVYALDSDNIEQYVYDLAPSRNGGVWAAALGGVFYFSNNSYVKYTVADGLSDSRVRGVAEGPDGALWAATYFGVSRYKDGQWHSWRSADGLAGDTVASVAVDPLGVAWFGTYGEGVSRFDGTTWTTYTTRDGLADNYVFAILPDSHVQRWFGTFGGASKQNDGGYSIYLPVAVR
jgi:ligand-binding sensor domain-containing protein